MLIKYDYMCFTIKYDNFSAATRPLVKQLNNKILSPYTYMCKPNFEITSIIESSGS